MFVPAFVVVLAVIQSISTTLHNGWLKCLKFWIKSYSYHIRFIFLDLRVKNFNPFGTADEKTYFAEPSVIEICKTRYIKICIETFMLSFWKQI